MCASLLLAGWQMHANSAIDDTLSGTTAITIIFFGDTMYVANVGDSRAIVAQRNEETGALQGFPLSDDQTPYRKVRTRPKQGSLIQVPVNASMAVW